MKGKGRTRKGDEGKVKMGNEYEEEKKGRGKVRGGE